MVGTSHAGASLAVLPLDPPVLLRVEPHLLAVVEPAVCDLPDVFDVEEVVPPSCRDLKPVRRRRGVHLVRARVAVRAGLASVSASASVSVSASASASASLLASGSVVGRVRVRVVACTLTSAPAYSAASGGRNMCCSPLRRPTSRYPTCSETTTPLFTPSLTCSGSGSGSGLGLGGLGLGARARARARARAGARG